MVSQPQVCLNDRNTIPQLGLGVWKTPPDVTSSAVDAALRAGYRHVDTAAAYHNEAGVGEGIRAAGVARENIFVATKLWNDDQGYDSTLRAFDDSLTRLGLDYVDLYLIHWPSPGRGLYVDTWKAFIQLKEQGRVRSIGVCNFAPEHLSKIISETGVTPAINQIELHPRFQQRKLRDFNAKHGIATQSWSPLGRGTLLTDPTIVSIADKHGRTPAQIIIRWHIDNGLIVIPKSVSSSRIIENFDVFGFGLDETDLAAIAKLNSGDGRIGPDPEIADF
ncbi:aldo/keto reductase [Agrobacterium sp. MOPV5]|uniref:aldo/keto reductase n=1 Tax=Agrobacterium leguminum TaxID=2792015 RepID=UPI0018C3070D|nr:aldo/keto reductase [Agrobacterium leguminum]